MGRREYAWGYVHSCEHCGEFEIPQWGAWDGGTYWCSTCADSDGEDLEIPDPPKTVEKLLDAALTAVEKANQAASKFNKKVDWSVGRWVSDEDGDEEE